MAWDYLDSHDLKLSNRPVRTRMPGGVAGVPPKMEAPYADLILRWRGTTPSVRGGPSSASLSEVTPVSCVADGTSNMDN